MHGCLSRIAVLESSVCTNSAERVAHYELTFLFNDCLVAVNTGCVTNVYVWLVGLAAVGFCLGWLVYTVHHCNFYNIVVRICSCYCTVSIAIIVSLFLNLFKFISLFLNLYIPAIFYSCDFLRV